MKQLNIAIIGYGKMGEEIETMVLERGHNIGVIIDLDNISELDKLNEYLVDVAIEFSNPASAIENIKKCFRQGVPVICGTTGWNAEYETIKKLCLETNQAILASSNFSIGVNLFFSINQILAEYMNKYEDYNVEITEIHHTQKLDSPSGTAIVLAQKIIEKLNRKTDWVVEKKAAESEIKIFSERIEGVPGTHIVDFSSDIDTIELKHVAKNRRGFATGAVMAAEFIYNKKGWFDMKDLFLQKK